MKIQKSLFTQMIKPSRKHANQRQWSWLLKCLTINALAVFYMDSASAQNKVVKIEFNEKGQMTSTPPPMITTNDHIDFKVTTTQAFREERVLATYKLFQQTLNLVNKRDAGNNYVMIKTLGMSGGMEQKAGDIIGVFSRKLAAALVSYLDTHKSILSKFFDVDKEKGLVSNYLPAYNIFIPNKKQIDAADKAYKGFIQIPDMEKICFPDFYILPQVVNYNGLNIKSQCNKPFSLDKCTSDCDVTYTHRLDFNDIVDGPVRMDFELRMDNNVFSQMIAQINSSDAIFSALSGLDIPELKKAYMDQLDFKGPHMGLPDTKIAQLQKYIAAMEEAAKTGKLVQAAKLPDVNLTINEITQVRGFMSQDFDDIVANVQSPEVMAWLLQLSWLSGGQNISANPVVWDISVKPDEELTKNNKQITSLQKDSVQIAQELSLLENVSKSANSAAGLTNLQSKYDALLVKKKANDASLEALRAANKDIKTPKPDPFTTQIKKMFTTSDSLFYKGFFYVNYQAPKNTKGWWKWAPDTRDEFYHPNRLNYAFMRNHNALEDYELKGKAPVRGINETQRLFIIVDNALDKTKIIAKTTYTDVKLSDDHDQLILEPVSATSFRSTDTLKQAALKKLFTTYEKYKGLKDKLFAPFANGVLKMPVQRITDKTPDYVSRLVAHQGPFNAPSTVSYQLLDSATSKNLSLEGNTYTYRFNKLYRFRIKAGITYSWLQNKSYTINPAANTATYTNSYTGLAPSVGIQVFTTRLDIQSTRVFPHGAAPFVYLGYLYTGAPAANILLGGGWEVFSGVAVTGGVYLGRSQSLTLVSGTLQEKDVYKVAPFISLNIGLEAFNAIFNTAKPTANPFKQ